MNPARHRAGTLLIMIAGVAAVIATVSIAFLVRMRSDVEEMGIAEREAQARLMLIAACSYVQEASRIGYDNATPDASLVNHREAFGWIDVRNGATGPLGEPVDPAVPSGPGSAFVPLFSPLLVEDGDGDGLADRPAWPAIGGVARCPMYAMKRPPFAVQLTVAYNPIAADGADAGLPYLLQTDPKPVAASKAEFWNGDRMPRAESTGMSWFRVYRDEAAVFIVACGAGGTEGFRDWNEVHGLGAEQEFGYDPGLFEHLRLAETRRWFRIEWSGAVAPSEVHNVANALNTGSVIDQYVQFPMNTSDCDPATEMRSQAHCINMGGTIRWVQRLRDPPPKW